MNYKIIKLLFDPRGTSSKKEFLEGVILLFLLALYYISSFLLNNGPNTLIGRQGPEILAAYMQIKPLSIPLLPVNFIIFYSSIVLSIKRVKDIGGSLWMGILAGLCIFLFFDGTFIKVMTNFALVYGIGSVEIEESIKIFHLSITSLATTLGLAVMITLLVFKDSKVYEKERKEKGVLTISQFITQLGILCAVAAILSISMGLLFVFYERIFYAKEILAIALIIISLSFLTWYFVLVFKRLKSAGKPFYLFLICFVVYISSLIFVGILSYKSSNLNVINISVSALSVVSMLFTLANISLFMLKEAEPDIRLPEENTEKPYE